MSVNKIYDLFFKNRHSCCKNLEYQRCFSGCIYCPTYCVYFVELHRTPLFEQTCKEGHQQRHPAKYVGPREAPVTKTLAQEVHRHPRVNGHRKQNKQS